VKTRAPRKPESNEAYDASVLAGPDEAFNYFWSQLRKTWDGVTPTHKMVTDAFFAGWWANSTRDIARLRLDAEKQIANNKKRGVR
jgi:hypothetical protein